MNNVNTQAVRGGQEELGTSAFPSPSIALNSAVHLESIEDGWDMLTNGVRENFAYQRYANPTVSVLERKFAVMEGAEYALAVNSGMTAINLLFRALLKSGDHVVAQHGIYHEISDQLKLDFDHCGISTTFIENYGTDDFVGAIRPETRCVFVESPTNPTFLDVDIHELAIQCSSRNILLVVDNTMLTHLLCKPLELGALLCVYSLTKTINGHGDVVGGILTTNNYSVYCKLKEWRDNTGVILDPHSAWLVIRGLRTLPMRIDRHEANVARVLSFLSTAFPQIPVRHALTGAHAVANGVKGVGGIISIELPSRDSAIRFVRALNLFRLATTFGNLESLCYHFGAFARPGRDITKIGIPLGLVRLSVGVEDYADIEVDLWQALIHALESE